MDQDKGVQGSFEAAKKLLVTAYSYDIE